MGGTDTLILRGSDCFGLTFNLVLERFSELHSTSAFESSEGRGTFLRIVLLASPRSESGQWGQRERWEAATEVLFTPEGGQLAVLADRGLALLLALLPRAQWGRGAQKRNCCFLSKLTVECLNGRACVPGASLTTLGPCSERRLFRSGTDREGAC